jgi:hypothetical protein
VHIDGVPTKHYSESELHVVLADAGFIVSVIKKVEYEWNTELAEVPAWLQDPYPWDWLVECKKI